MNESNDFIQMQGINSLGFGIIPKLVMQDKRLTIQAKAIYGYFCSYAGAGRTAFPGREKIVSDLKISKDSYYKHFNLLKKYGYIQTVQEKAKTVLFEKMYIHWWRIYRVLKIKIRHRVLNYRVRFCRIPSNRTLIITVLKVTD